MFMITPCSAKVETDGEVKAGGAGLPLMAVGLLALAVRGVYLAEISRTPLVQLLMGDAAEL